MPVTATVLFCDDIRFEMSGKMLFIGVYLDDLVPVVLPLVIPLAIWVRVQGLSPGSHELRFAVGANGVPQLDGGMTVVVTEGRHASHLTLVGLSVELKDCGHIFLTLTGFPDGQTVHAELPVLKPPETAGLTA